MRRFCWKGTQLSRKVPEHRALKSRRTVKRNRALITSGVEDDVSDFLDYVRRAQDDRVPYSAVLRRCLNWGVPRAKAEDLADESSIVSYGKAFEKERTISGYFTSEKHFRAWVTTSAFWHAIGELREGNQGPDGLPPDIPGPEPSPEPEESPFTICFARLSEVERRILTEVSEKKSHEEIAAILEVEFPEAIRVKAPSKEPAIPPSLNAIRLRVFRMLEKAKQQLETCLIAHGSSPYVRRKSPFLA
jgi:DNA-directed RNA polymerase specialized sigma24 family protein